MGDKHYTIIVADDDDAIRNVLVEFLRKKGHTVFGAVDGAEAARMIPDIGADMVISDIQMPNLDGFGLFRLIDDKYPQIKRILMTGYDIDGYIQMIRRNNIGNILAKGSDFDLIEVGRYVDSLLSGEIFGLERFLPTETTNRALIVNSRDAGDVCKRIVAEYPEENRFFLEVAIDELISNAVFHGVLQVSSAPRDEWPADFTLNPADAVRVSWARDTERIGVSVEDPKGNLRKVDVLRWLDHPIDSAPDENEHGRGFILVRKFIDRFIINIDRGKRTECIILQNLSRDPQRTKRQKPLLIHEL